jgi:diguanylate cyclase (GGDEF)-like protein/PAS domain S-box-containing protein
MISHAAGRLRQASAFWLFAFVAVFVLGHYLLPLSSVALLWWADGFWTVASLLAALRCLATARLHTNHLRHAWQLFAAGCFAWFGGMLIWDYCELILGQITPFPALSDIGYLLLVPLFAAGLLLYRIKSPGVPLRSLDLSQLGVFISCIVISHIILFHDSAIAQDQSPLSLATALAYPAFYMTLFVQAAITLWTLPPGPPRQALSFVIAGIAVFAVTNSLYAYALLGHAFVTGGYLDAAWVAGFALIYYGAAHRAAAMENNEPVNLQELLPRSLHLSRLLTPLALLATVAVVLLFRQKITLHVADELLTAAVVLFIFLAAREWISGALQEQLNIALRISEEELRKITRLAPVGIFRNDKDGRCIYVNEHWYTITGRAPQQTYGGGWAEALHPEDRAKVLIAWRNAVSRQGVFKAEYRFLHQNGKTVWVVGEALPEYDENGLVTGYIGSFTDITARKQTEQALSESEERFRKTFHASPVVMSLTRLQDGRLIDINKTYETVFGWRRDEAVGHTTRELNIWANPQDRDMLINLLTQQGVVHNIELLFNARSGDKRYLLGSAEILSINGENCMLAVFYDITDRKRAEAEREKLARAIEQTTDVVMIANRDGIIEYVNPAFETTTGFSANEALGGKPSLLKSGVQDPEFYKRLWQTILSGQSFNDVFVNRKKDGTLYYEEKTITPLTSTSGEITHFVATGRDISERMQSQVQLQHMAHHDALTNLPNRALFLDRLKQALARARWHKRLVAVLFIDIDRFKNINDTLGHEIGDTLLQELSSRLLTCLRDGDTAARFGGDEFVVLLNDIAAATDVSAIAQNILDLLRPPFRSGDTALHVTASIGISLFPADGEDAGRLLRHADIAMYRAKDRGRNNYQFYSAEMSAHAFERLTLENSLHHALERDEFLLHYQPQVNLQTGAVIGVEALLRWQHPDFGLVSPVEFIPLLEETGMILPVGRWVLQEACRQLAEWRKRGWTDLMMAVNLSSLQLTDVTLLSTVESALTRYGLPPHLLELELTESAILQHGDSARETLEALRQLGARLALDDFGTGYSSLSHVQNFDFDTLKIDRSFVMDIPGDAVDTAIAEAIIALGKSLKLNLIAEGVETEIQRDFLRGLGCHVMQGYLFSRPRPASEIPAYLSSHCQPKN